MLLSVENLRKTFSDTPVLHGIDLEVEKGDVVAIIGPSGSGKTTLLRCLNFLEKADGGRMTFAGETFDLAKISRKNVLSIRKRTGFVFQNYNLFLNKTALENITEGLIVGRGIKKGLALAKAHELLARFSLTHRENAYPSELSGGQQQRVAIARALAGDPDIIYFDEPTSALDPELTRDVLSILKELAQQGLTMVVVTHELTFAKSVANKVVFMEAGHVVEAGDAQTIFGTPKELRTKNFWKRLSEHQANKRFGKGKNV